MSRITDASTPQRVVSAANAAASVTFPATEGRQHRLTMVTASYSGAAGLPSVTAPGRVMVTDGATTTFEWDITGPGSYTVPYLLVASLAPPTRQWWSL